MLACVIIMAMVIGFVLLIVFLKYDKTYTAELIQTDIETSLQTKLRKYGIEKDKLV